MSESRILIAEDEESIRFVLTRALEGRGYHVRAFAEGLTALAALRTGGYDLAIVDIRLPDVSGLDLLSRARDEGLDVPILVMTAESTMQNAIEAMKRGAFDYLTKPFDIEEVQLLVERALGLRRLSLMVENLKEEMRPQFTPGSGLVGKSAAMQEIYKTIGRVAESDATVLLQGESGTGKELIGDPAGAPRERAFRPRARRVHRSGGACARQVRDRRQGHAVPRRDLRAAARPAGQAAARVAGARVHTRRRPRADA